jgi:hydrophobe/amphiphile efflux-1 (HAE1) family protein
MNLPKFAVKRPVTVSVIFIIMILFGIYSLFDLPIDLMPEIEFPAVSVIVTYRGAGSEEVEEKVSKVLEGALSTVSSLKEISSRSMENVSTVNLEFNYGTDMSDAINNIRDRMNLVRGFLPDGIDEPMIFRFDSSIMPILFISVTSPEVDIRYQGKVVEEYISNHLERLPGVGSVINFNEMRKKIIVSIDKQRLATMNLSISDVTNTIRAENLSLPAGNLEIGAFDYTVRIPGEFTSVEEISETIIANTPSGLIKIKDVARVFWGSDDSRQFAIKDGEYMVFMMVQKQSDANTVAVSRAVLSKLDELKERLPYGMEVSTLMDTSEFILKMVKNLANAVLTACLFVILIVVFFLRRFKSSFIILLAIPASLIIAFAFLYGFGYTLNMVSMMALSLAIGMVVDNSIVVLDNITRHLESGKSKIDSAVDGTTEVGGAIMASTITTIMIFSPLFFVGGLMGILFGQLAGVVVLTLSASLLAAMLLTPMVCSKILEVQKKKTKTNWFFNLGEKFLNFAENGYTNIIKFTLQHRKKTILSAAILFIFSLTLIPIVGLDFLPEGDEGLIMVEYEMPLGTKIDVTLKTAQHIERIVREEIPPDYLIRSFVRGGPNDSGFSQNVEDTNTATVGAKIISQDYRNEHARDFANVIRQRVINEVPGIEKLDVKSVSGMDNMISGGEKPVTIKLANRDFKVAADAALKLEKEFEKIQGLNDISNDADSLKPQVEVKIDRVRASQVGLKASMVAMAVRSAFYGDTASIFREDGDEFEIMVRLQKPDRENLEQLKELRLKTLYGTTVKLKDVAEIKEGLTSLAVNRQNRERIVTVGARLDQSMAIGTVMEEVDKAIERADIPPEVDVIYGGTLKQQKETSGDLFLMLLLGVVLVYLVMAAQFESFIDPFVIIFAIPFSVTGVILGLLVTGNTLSVPAFLGMIILVGVVVNNAIVLIDYTKIMKEKHKFTVDEALIYAGSRRLRPILMTAATTIFGMVPLAFMSGEGHETFNPMGVAVVFGLSFSTLVTLVLMPVMYSYIKDRKRETSATN